jgi:hypothetical protein
MKNKEKSLILKFETIYGHISTNLEGFCARTNQGLSVDLNPRICIADLRIRRQNLIAPFPSTRREGRYKSF